MRLHEDPIIPAPVGPTFQTTLKGLLAAIVRQLNGVTEGRIAVSHGALTAAPTAGTWQRGDFVRNSAPSELGTAGSRYVLRGWICTVGGTPGTWVECRNPTGN